MNIDPVQMLFIVGSPRSGTTMLERILSSHSKIRGGPEPHLLTPLAHLGVWDKVEKASYDHVLAAEAQRGFVAQLPAKEVDYWQACRAYCDVLYGRYLSTGPEEICLDKTPAYALILPFMEKVFPDAKYVVLTRHPVATFSSFANSFFNGDYEAAQSYNPILQRYVPAIANFIRQDEVAFIHVRYEDLVQEPEEWVQQIFSYIGVLFEAQAVNYGDQEPDPQRGEGLGDPLGVQQYSRPSTESANKWAQELATSPEKTKFMQDLIAQLDPADLEVLGYPLEGLWKPLDEVAGTPIGTSKSRSSFSRYRLQRYLIVKLRSLAQKGGVFHTLLRKMQLGLDVILRE